MVKCYKKTNLQAFYKPIMNKYKQSNSNTYLIWSKGNNLEKEVDLGYLITVTLPL